MGIQALNIKKSFGDFVALDDVSVDVHSGQLTALLRPSGGGKSTLLRIIAGLGQVDSGTVRIDGSDATSLPPQRRDVGFVFQHYAAFKHLSVYRNVAFGRRWLGPWPPSQRCCCLTSPSGPWMPRYARNFGTGYADSTTRCMSPQCS